MKNKTKAIATIIIWVIVTWLMLPGCRKEQILEKKPNSSTSPPHHLPTDTTVHQKGITSFVGVPMNTDTNGWSCYRIVINAGFTLDSVFVDIERPGYPSSENDLYMYYINGVIWNNATEISCSTNYQTVSTSMYGVWLNEQPYHIVGPAVLQISAPPTNFGTIFTGWRVAAH